MIKSELFQNSEMIWPAIVIGVVVWLVFVWKEWRKPHAIFFYFNCLVALLTIATIAMLALKPQTVSISSDMGVLLTKGFEQKQLDSLQRLRKVLKVYPYQENRPMGGVLDSLSGIYVLGDGVQSFDFWQFKNRSVTHLGSKIPEGIIRLKYSKENRIGEDLILKGRYHASKNKNRLVVQDGNGLGIDSVVLDGNEFQNFELKFPLKTTGKFVFQLTEKDSLGELVSSNPVPFKVSARNNLRIVVINGFPSFETKYLKNYLSEMGHEVLIRSQLTKGRYKFEYLNTSRKPIYSLNEAVLKDFDLMIIDANSFRNLPRSAKKAVKTAIKKEGLGLFVQPDASIPRLSKEDLGFRLRSDGTSKVVLNDFPKRTWVKLRYGFEPSFGLEEIHAAGEKIVTGYKRSEKGRIGTTLVQNTYQLQLDGNKKTYQKFWSSIVEKLAKNYSAQTTWDLERPFPMENEPLSFELYTSVENPEVYTLPKNRIAIKQDAKVSTHWSGVTYPKTSGWNELQLKSDSLNGASFYVTDSISWTSLRQYDLQKENKRFFENDTQMPKPSLSYQPIEPIWFFLIGLLGLGYLWLYPKVFQN